MNDRYRTCFIEPKVARPALAKYLADHPTERFSPLMHRLLIAFLDGQGYIHTPNEGGKS